MSFKRLEPEDFLVSADSITAGAWSGNSSTLSSFFKNATQESSDSGKYYLSIYNTSDSSTQEPQFNIAYGNSKGSGSLDFNSNISGKSPSSTVYGQFQNIVLGDENTDFTFGDKNQNDFYALVVERARFKGNLLPGNVTLTLNSASAGTLVLTDNSVVASSVSFNEAGRVFQLVSGSAGSINTTRNSNGFHPDSGSYGLFLPDIGTVLLNAAALDTPSANGGLTLNTNRAPNTNGGNLAKLFAAVSGSAEVATSLVLSSQESLTSDFIFIRARNSEFNYSANPSFSSGSVGDVTFPEFISSPQTFITTVGLYNDENELLATAKLSKPLKKDFTKEALIRVKLDF